MGYLLTIPTMPTFLRIVKDAQPDIAYVQYEQGLYGMHLNALRPEATTTNIERFYDCCKVPTAAFPLGVYF